MYIRIPKEFIFSVEERFDLDFLLEGYRESDSDIKEKFNDEYAEADEEYFESVKG